MTEPGKCDGAVASSVVLPATRVRTLSSGSTTPAVLRNAPLALSYEGGQLPPARMGMIDMFSRSSFLVTALLAAIGLTFAAEPAKLTTDLRFEITVAPDTTEVVENVHGHL